MKKLFILLPLLLVACAEYECTQKSTVVEILSMEYKTVVVRFENGLVKSYRTPTVILTPGTEICLKKRQI